MRLNRQQRWSATAIISGLRIPIVALVVIIDVIVGNVNVVQLVLNDAREPVGVGSQGIREPPQLVLSLLLLRFFSLLLLLLLLPRPGRRLLIRWSTITYLMRVNSQAPLSLFGSNGILLIPTINTTGTSIRDFLHQACKNSEFGKKVQLI
jgi:hypothetical protein